MLKRYSVVAIFFIFLSSDVFAGERGSSFKIAVFREENFPYIGTPEGFSSDWIKKNLGEEYEVIYLDTEKFKNRSLFNVDEIDLLILPYGESIPEEALPLIVEFVKDGGGIFTTGGRPFGAVFKKKDNRWEREALSDGRKYSSSLGLYFYKIFSKDITSIKSESPLWGSAFYMAKPLNAQYGVCVKTSEAFQNIPPTKGNVFPYRIPARDFMTPVIFLDKKGNYTGAPITLVKSWKNPYKNSDSVPNKWCIISAEGESHPLNPRDDSSVIRLKKLAKFLNTKIIITGVETDFASYREGEDIWITVKILNYGESDKEVNLIVFSEGDNNDLLKEERKILVGGHKEDEINIEWNPGRLPEDFYKIKAVLEVDGEAVDEGYNGFTVWHEDVIKNTIPLTINGKDFYRNERPFYLYGVNYYESKTGELMWVRPNIMDIEKDLREMAQFGINFLRVHYHHPKWFIDYLKIKGLPLSDYFDDVTPSPLPDEKSLRILDAFIILCSRYNIYFQPDLFTLVPDEMGSPEGWIGDLERCRDAEKIKMQKEFVKLLSERYKEAPNVMWDLWNEPFLQKEDVSFLKKWAGEIVGYFRANGDRHLITLGSDESIELEDELDFVSGHGYEVKVPDVKKPFVFQEAWNGSDISPENEKKQADKLKRDFEACIGQGGAGFAPWQWTRQARLWDASGEAERWDNELGLCVREDGSLKPAGKMYMDLIRDTQ